MHLGEERESWRRHATGGRRGAKDQMVYPPALVKEYSYLCSTEWHPVSLRQADGEPGFLCDRGDPMAFHPSLAGGCMYVGTSGVLLLCLSTVSDDTDGWHMRGGNAQDDKSE
jgi:hypothetical protein